MIEPGEALAWYRQMLDQLNGAKEWTMPETDPAGKGSEYDKALRTVFSHEALQDIRPYRDDPLGNMMDWRDFLSRRIPVN